MGLFLFCVFSSFTLLQAAYPDSTRFTYKIPAKVKVNNAFGNPESNKGTLSNKYVLFDSLQNVISVLNSRNDSLINITKEQEGELKSIGSQLKQLSEENNNISNELLSANDDKLKSSHTNSILYIFNVLLGIIMLIALVWFMGRKKSLIGDKVSGNGFATNGKKEAFAPTIDYQLDRIEKLGNLRDKGLLTDDEFNFQKKQILAERS